MLTKPRWKVIIIFWGYVFILPAIILIGTFSVYPLIQAFILSFQIWRPSGAEWTGLSNYVFALRHPELPQAFLNTSIYSIATTIGAITISFLVATALMRWTSGLHNILKACYYLPGVISGVVLSFIWMWFYLPFGGLFNSILNGLGLPNAQWLSSPDTAMTSIILMALSVSSGPGIVLYTAAFARIPDSLYEVAEIEGANWVQRLRFVSWPLVIPTTIYILIMSLIGGYQVFEQIYVMTQGGPMGSTVTMVYLIWSKAFSYGEFGGGNFGVASAIAILLAVFIFTISILQYKFLSKDTEY